MHIEKNVCENLVGTQLNIEEKTKDTTNARLDLQDLKIIKDLHLIEVSNRLVKPYASYTLTSSERVEFCKYLKSVKFLNGFVYNISRRVNEKERKYHVSKCTIVMFCYINFYLLVFELSY